MMVGASLSRRHRRCCQSQRSNYTRSRANIFNAPALLAIVLIFVTSSNVYLVGAQTCADTVDPSDPCNHDCCQTQLFGNQCVEDAASPNGLGYRCECSSPHVAQLDSSQCGCASNPCGSNTQSADCSFCVCQASETCLGNQCRLEIDSDGAYRYPHYSSTCTSCSCVENFCDEELTLSTPIKSTLRICSCKYDRYKCSGGCARLSRPNGRDVLGFQPSSCSSCACYEVQSECSLDNPVSVSQLTSDMVFYGQTRCAADSSSALETYILRDIEVVSAASSEIKGRMYMIKNGAQGVYDIETLINTGQPGCFTIGNPADMFLVEPAVSGRFRPTAFALQLHTSTADMTLHMEGTITNCDSSIDFVLLDACDEESEYRPVFSQSCLTATVCSAGEYIATNITTTTDRSCQVCSPGFFADEENSFDCAPYSNCPPGTFVSGQPNATHDRVCSPCPDESFSTTANAAMCTPAQECLPGIIETVQPTSTTDRVCTNCNGVLEYQDEAGMTDCKQVTRCWPGSYQTVPPTITSDRSCMNCTAMEYQPLSDQTSCLPHSDCGAGSYVTVGPTRTSNRRCRACDGISEYQDEVNKLSCKDVTACPRGMEQAQPPTNTTNRVCTQCILGETFKSLVGQSPCLNATVCDAGYHETVSPTLTSDRVCDECPDETFKESAGTALCMLFSQCFPGTYISANGTSTSDVQCMPCDAGSFSSARNLHRCTPFTECGEGEYTHLQPSPSNDRECRSITECDADEWEIRAPSTSNDRICEPCTVCSGYHEELQPCTPTSDTQCKRCTVCTAGNHLVQRCNETSDGVCGPCTVCTADEYELSPCAESFNRVCAPLTVCAGHQYEERLPTAIEDRICTNLTVCDYPSEYAIVAATPTSDRECAPISPECDMGYYEARAPTASSDRECEVCAAGTVDDDSNPLTACVSCEGPGYHLPAGQVGNCSEYLCMPGAVDADQMPETECQACTDGYQDEFGQTMCKAWSECPPGTEVVSRTMVQDSVCGNCTLGLTFRSNSTIGDACVAVTECPPGETLFAQPTRSSDRVCISCPANTYKDLEGSQACKPVRECGAGSEEQDAPTPSSNRVCKSCVAGETFKASSNTSLPCQDVRLCGLGFGQSIMPTLTSDRVCRQCELSFSDSVGPDPCASYRVCAAGEEESVPPTTSSNRECVFCVEGETFKQNSGPGECESTTHCGAGEFIATAATLISDRLCLPCPSGSFKESDDLHASCLPHSPLCASTEFESQVATTSTDRMCASLTQCAEDAFIYANATVSSDRMCQRCRTCPTDHVTLAECTPYQDTQCEGCIECGFGTFLFEACTNETNTVCRECTECDLGSEYVFEACTEFHDTICMPRTNCTALQYDARTPGSVIDSICTNVTQCIAGVEYESSAPTASSDRVCRRISRCDAGTELRMNATATSDTVCRACAAGLTDRDGDPATPCVPCDPGTFTNGSHVGACPLCAAGSVDADVSPATPCQPCILGSTFQNAMGMSLCLSTTQCPRGYEEDESPTLSSDRSCSECPEETFKDSQGQADCVPHMVCARGYGAIVLGTIETDTECVKCAAGNFKDTVASVPCESYSECRRGEYEIEAGTFTSDRICQTCPAGTFKAEEGSFSTCRPLTICDAADEYESVPGTSSSDRGCTDLTVCSETQYEATPPTLTTDRVCAPRSRLFTVDLFLNSSYQLDATTAEKRSNLTIALRKALTTDLGVVQLFVDVDYREDDQVRDGAIVADVSVGSRAVRDRLVGRVFTIQYYRGPVAGSSGPTRRRRETVLPNGLVEVSVQLFTEDEARLALIDAYNAAIMAGSSESEATDAAYAAYTANGGMITPQRAFQDVSDDGELNASTSTGTENAAIINAVIMGAGILIFIMSSMIFGITTYRMRKNGYFKDYRRRKVAVGNLLCEEDYHPNPTFRPEPGFAEPKPLEKPLISKQASRSSDISETSSVDVYHGWHDMNGQADA